MERYCEKSLSGNEKVIVWPHEQFESYLEQTVIGKVSHNYVVFQNCFPEIEVKISFKETS